MKYISYHHGYPLKLGNKTTGWRSCYNSGLFGLRWISAIIAWFYHNLMCYFDIKIKRSADKIICISEATKKQLLEQDKVISKRGFIGMLIYNIR